MVVEKCNTHTFVSSDAMRQDGFSVHKCLTSDCVSVVSKVTENMYCNNSSSINTRYFAMLLWIENIFRVCRLEKNGHHGGKTIFSNYHSQY